MTSQFNSLQKNSNNKVQSGKKDDKPEVGFPPNMQNIPGIMNFSQNPNNQSLAMFPQGLNPQMIQMMQSASFNNSKDKSEQS